MKAWRLVGVIYAGALVGGLLAYSGVLLAGEGPIVAEGIVLPVQTAPRAVADAPARPKTGMSRWAFWPALIAQGAACGTQEWGYAHISGQIRALGVTPPTNGWARLRSCALNLGPVLGMKWAAERWDWPAEIADTQVVPSTAWGTYGAIKNIYDIRKADALLRRVREAR